jgi:hypothetical protein
MRLAHCIVIVPLLLSPGQRLTPQDADQSLAVYAVVLDSIRASGRNSYFVADQTVPLLPTDGWKQSLRSRASLPGLMTTLLVELNGTRFALDRRWIDSVSTIPAYPALEAQAVSSNWRIGFSRVAFSSDGGTALVYVMEICGGRCGGAGVVELRNEEGRWRIEHWERLMRF